MRVVIAGSRTITDSAVLRKAIKQSGFKITVVICGKALGIDTLGERWALKNKIKVEYYPADWAAYGKAAGMIRNLEMLDVAEAVIAIWDGKSKGTKHTIDQAKKRRLKLFVFRTDQTTQLPKGLNYGSTSSKNR